MIVVDDDQIGRCVKEEKIIPARQASRLTI
jgi:hypothetical protein